jgi:hypothetical protein
MNRDDRPMLGRPPADPADWERWVDAFLDAILGPEEEPLMPPSSGHVPQVARAAEDDDGG